MIANIRADQYLQNSNQINQPTASLRSCLNKYYGHKRKWDPILFIEKKRLIPFTSEIRRFILSFESKIQSGNILFFKFLV